MSRKILIVEDNENNRLLLGDILRFHGHEVLEAENGRAGLEAARAHLPDLIFMDIQMPEMNGIEAIRALRADPLIRHIRVIAVTSFAMAGDQESILAAGADGYISKPYNTREIPALVKRLLGGSETQEAGGVR